MASNIGDEWINDEAPENVDDNLQHTLGDHPSQSNFIVDRHQFESQSRNLSHDYFFDKDAQSLTSAEVMTLEFTSVDDAEKWYKMYAYVMGFGVYKSSTVHARLSSHCLVGRLLCCSNQGQREKKYRERESHKREPMPKTRTGCQANFHVHLDRSRNR